MKNSTLSAVRGATVVWFACTLLCVAQAPKAPATGSTDWPCWRGPDRNGISKDSDWNPAALNGGPKIAWKASVGDGYSSVAVTGTNLYTMGNRGDKDTVYCLDTQSGKEVWHYSYACKGGDHPGPRVTPAVDGGVLYTLSYEGHVFCLDAATGSPKWQKNIASEFQAKAPQWGHSASPVIEGNLLLLNAGAAGIALNKTSGEKVWSTGAGICGYAAPVVYTAGGRKCAAIFGQKALHGVDIANGRQLWSYQWETSYDINAADPIFDGTHLFISSGYDKGCALLSVSGAKPVEQWQSKIMRNQLAGCILFNGALYGTDGNTQGGVLRCVDPKTGKEKWNKNLGYGSVAIADGKLIFLNEQGELFVAEASPAGYKEISRSKPALGPTCWTPPVLCRGKIYCRNQRGDLACVDVAK